jgi:CspA family cold shock protein
MQYGTVKWFDVHQGLGCIRPDNGSDDVLVDISVVEQSGMTALPEGEAISFVISDQQPGAPGVVSWLEGSAAARHSHTGRSSCRGAAPLSILSSAEVREMVLDVLG